MKQSKRLFIATLLIMGTVQVLAGNYRLKSPRGLIEVDIQVGHQLVYTIRSGQKAVIENGVASLDLDNGRILGSNMHVDHAKRQAIKETLTPVVPRNARQISNNCNVLSLQAKDYSIEFRAYDDGAAYRFVTSEADSITVKNEELAFQVPAGSVFHLSKTRSFITEYENPYSHIPADRYTRDSLMSYLPVLIEESNGQRVLLSETGLRDYPAMFVKGDKGNALQALFPQVPAVYKEVSDRQLKIERTHDYIARTSGSHCFPWRYFYIVGRDADLPLNDFTTRLADPSELNDDGSWIKPGQVSWDWWNHLQLKGVDFHAGINDATYRYYIDFAAHYGIPYILLDEGWARDTRDPFTTIDDIHLQSLVDYAAKKHVRLILWFPWLTVDRHFDLFAHYSKMCIAGVKIDFMNRSDQWMVNFYERVAKEAARCHLMVDFHGSFKPAGLESRYPNVVSYEGVMGMEQSRCRPKNSIYLPFMRNAVGPMDFTPGSMLSAQPADMKPSHAYAMGCGTRAYQMALYVVFQSGVQMLADSPTRYYDADECTRFITSVPVNWDETRVLEAHLGESFIMARRKGNRWWIGALTNDKARDLTIDLSFLSKGSYQLTAFQDGVNADQQATDYKKTEQSVTPATTFKVHLAPNGGWCGQLIAQ